MVWFGAVCGEPPLFKKKVMTIKCKEDFYSRKGITIREVRNLGAVLGLPICRHFRFLAELAVTLKMKY